MADDRQVLAEFLMKLGYEVDDAGHRRVEQQLTGLEKTARAVGVAFGAMFAVDRLVAFNSQLARLNIISQRVGASAGNIQAMGRAAELTGSSANAMIGTLTKFSDKFHEMPNFRQFVEQWAGKDAVQDPFTGRMKDRTETLMQFADAMKRLRDQGKEWTAIQVAGVAGISYNELLSLWDVNTKRLQEQHREIRKQFQLDTQAATEQGRKFTEEWAGLTDRVGAAFTKIAISPEFAAGLKELSAAVDDNKDLIVGGLNLITGSLATLGKTAIEALAGLGKASKIISDLQAAKTPEERMAALEQFVPRDRFSKDGALTRGVRTDGTAEHEKASSVFDRMRGNVKEQTEETKKQTGVLERIKSIFERMFGGPAVPKTEESYWSKLKKAYGFGGGEGGIDDVASGPQRMGAGGKINAAQAAALIRKVGGTEKEAQILGAISQPESGGNPNAHNPNAGTGDNSYGLWQINMLGAMGPERRRKFGLRSNEDLFDPETNARVALRMYRERGNFSDWTTYTAGKHRAYLDAAGRGARDGYTPEQPAPQAAAPTPPRRPVELPTFARQRMSALTGGRPLGDTSIANHYAMTNNANRQISIGPFNSNITVSGGEAPGVALAAKMGSEQTMRKYASLIRELGTTIT